MLVLCGSFQSFDAGGAEACLASLSECFSQLAALLARYPYLKVRPMNALPLCQPAMGAHKTALHLWVVFLCASQLPVIF